MKRLSIVVVAGLFTNMNQAIGIAQGTVPPAAPQKSAFATGSPSDREIQEAKAKGLVWTNPTTKVYHKNGEFYGKTKNGRFMTEAEAIRLYYRPSPDSAKKAAPTAGKPVTATNKTGTPTSKNGKK